MMETIRGRLIDVSECTDEEIGQCVDLLAQNFASVTEDDFLRDLKEKERIALIEAWSETEHTSRIVGFSTMVTFAVGGEQQTHHCIFSGDTTIAYHYRRSFELGKSLGCYFVDMIERHEDQDLWYVLISKGWKTYKAMEFLFKEFSPHPLLDHANDECGRVIDAFARARYKDVYDPRRRVLVAKDDAQRLRETSPDLLIPENNLLAQFFAARNPGYVRGDELICCARVTMENFTERFLRVISKHVEGR